MICDLRTYTCRPAAMNAHLELYGEHGYRVQRRHLGTPLVYAVTESGPLNSFVHLWAFENAGDRETRRAAMEADPEWVDYRRKGHNAGFLVSQEKRLPVGPVAFLSKDPA